MNTRPDERDRELEARLRDALRQRAAATIVPEREWEEIASLGTVVALGGRRSRRVIWGAVVAAAALVALVVGAVAVLRDNGRTTVANVSAGATNVVSDGLPVFEPSWLPSGFGPMAPAKERAAFEQHASDVCLRWHSDGDVTRCTELTGVTWRAYEKRGLDGPLDVVTVTGASIDALYAGEDGHEVEVRGHRAT